MQLIALPALVLAKKLELLWELILLFIQGFFLAPTVTAGALKGAIFAANIYERLGFSVTPNSTESRHDIIQQLLLVHRKA